MAWEDVAARPPSIGTVDQSVVAAALLAWSSTLSDEDFNDSLRELKSVVARAESRAQWVQAATMIAGLFGHGIRTLVGGGR